MGASGTVAQTTTDPPDKISATGQKKIAATIERDIQTNHLLEADGWTVVRIWEHDDPRLAAQRIAGVMANNRATP